MTEKMWRNDSKMGWNWDRDREKHKRQFRLATYVTTLAGPQYKHNSWKFSTIHPVPCKRIQMLKKEADNCRLGCSHKYTAV